GTVIRRSVFERLGGYDSSKRYAIDTDMWVRLSQTGDVAYIDEALHAYRQHGANMTGRRETVAQSIREKLDIIESYCRDGKAADVRRPATKRALSEWSNQLVFEQHDVRTGWQYWWVAFKMKPL